MWKSREQAIAAMEKMRGSLPKKFEIEVNRCDYTPARYTAWYRLYIDTYIEVWKDNRKPYQFTAAHYGEHAGDAIAQTHRRYSTPMAALNAMKRDMRKLIKSLEKELEKWSQN